MTLTLRRATMKDASTLFDWRNDQLTRSMSLRPDHVGWEEHEWWLSASLVNPCRVLMIAELDGEPVGTVRLDYGDETEMSWTVAPSHRGKGIGSVMIAAAMPAGDVIAWIKPENVASQRIAEKAGFVLSGHDGLQKWSRAAQIEPRAAA